MKNLISILILFTLGTLLGGIAIATQIEGFDYTSDVNAQADWQVLGNDSVNGGTGAIYAETTIKHDGISSLKFVYNYSGNQFYEMSIKKIFSSPQDFSDIKKYSMWIYNTNASSSTQIWYIRFYTNTNCVYRYVDWGRLGWTGWQKKSFDLGMMQTDPWIGSNLYDTPNLSNVTAVQIIIQTSDATSPGQTVLYLDDLEGYQKSNLSWSQALYTFNYPNNDALTTAWTVSPSVGGTLAISTSTVSFAGDGSLSMYYQMTAYWYNVFCENQLPSTMDMSSVVYFNVWVYGDYNADTAANPLFLFTVQDTSVNRAWARIMNGLHTPGWHCQYMRFLIGPTDGSIGSSNAGTFWQDKYDGGGSSTPIDISAIGKIGMNLQTSAAGTANFTVYFDEIDYGYNTTIPFTASVSAVYAKPGDSPIPITVTSGVGPFTWSLSSSDIGSISTTAGSSVTFTPSSTVSSGSITINDSTGESLVIPVSIVPTSAPLAPESTYMPTHIKQIRRDWALFE